MTTSAGHTTPAKYCIRQGSFSTIGTGGSRSPPFRPIRAQTLAAPVQAAGSRHMHGPLAAATCPTIIRVCVSHADRLYCIASCVVAEVNNRRTARYWHSNRQEGIRLGLEGHSSRSAARTEKPRLVVTYEVPVARHAAEA